MSATGYLFVGTAEPEVVDRLRRTVPDTTFAPLAEDADLAWWRTMDDAALLAPPDPRYTCPGPSEPAIRFVETLDALRPDPAVLDTCLTALAETPESEFFHVGVRKGDPVAALYYGLGFADARRLPGRLGCFLLDADQVRSSLARIEHLPECPLIGREKSKARTAAWLSAVSDEPGLDPDVLLDEPLRILRLAHERSVGAIGLMQWY